MKLRLALSSFAMVAAMTVAPMSSQAGGLMRDRSHCPLSWLMRHHHAAPAMAAPVKKHAAKPAKAAAKPMK